MKKKGAAPMGGKTKKKTSKEKRLCGYGLSPEGDTLEQMLECYCKKFRPVLAEYLNVFRKYDLDDVIRYATGSVCPCCGLRHPHQRRLSGHVLEEFAGRLQSLSDQIKKAENFESLHELVVRARIKGIGPVTLYDAALRISAKLSILPQKVVYLHGHALIPQMPGTHKMDISGFAPQFSRKNLTAYEIEEFLCVFNARLVEKNITVTK